MADRKISYPKSGLWKDYFDQKRVGKMADEIQAVFPSFDKRQFVRAVFSNEWDSLELKERLRHIATALRKSLPADYKSATKILIKVAPHLPEFENWALATYVELFGLEHFERSIEVMAKLTEYGTAEFAIRPFMNRYTDKMLGILNKWAKDPNEHIRRLSAEGSRPRGVWVEHIYAFRENPTDVLKLLEKMKADESLYVRKAVANNLNDISRDHPDLVIDLCKRWHDKGNKNTQWIVRRACRTLIKKGDRGALSIFGFTTKPAIKLSSITLNPQSPAIGSKLGFSFTLTSQKKTTQKLAIDYAIFFRKANGGHTRKLFKLTETTISAQQRLPLSGRHSFRPLSTRTYHSGEHKIQLLVNGQQMTEITFELTE